MKLKTFFAISVLLFLLQNLLFGDNSITKGPVPGELYFLMPFANNNTGLAISHSWDYGNTFSIMDSTGAFGNINADADSGGIYSRGNGGALYFSATYGRTWSYRGLIHGGEFSSGRISGEIIENAIWYSDDYGFNFVQQQANGISGDIGDYESFTIGNLAGEIYFLSSKGFLFLSADTGSNFVLQSNLNLVEGYWHYLRRGAITGELYLYNSDTKELFFSSDSGLTFNLQYTFNFQPTDIWYSDMTGSQEAGEVFILAYRYFPMSFNGEFYIYHSTDYGQTWTANHHPMAIKTEPVETISGFKLEQNYPNPFNSNTQIEFYLPVKEKVEISVYDVTGAFIKTLVNKPLSPGRHVVEWNGTNAQDQLVSSGLYFYQMKTSAFSQSKKLLYIR